ncbi:MAG: acyltransferase [bacterium]|nr:acyltransferase [bacterium]
MPWQDLDRKRSSYGLHLPALDGARGVAALIVVASHSGAFSMKGQGGMGVLWFFLLSGFVLSLPYVERPGALLNTAELGRFFRNRVLRIVPIYLVAVALLSTGPGRGLEWFLWNASFIKGWNHLWSVAEEVRFYLLFPLVMGVLATIPGRVARIAVTFALLIAAFLARQLHLIDMMVGETREFYFWFFLGGVLVGQLSHEPRIRSWVRSRPAGVLFTSSSLLIGAFLVLSSNAMVRDFWRPLIPGLRSGFSLNGWAQPELWLVLFSLLTIDIVLRPKGLVGRILGSRIVRLAGLLSYSTYLFHLPVVLMLAPRIVDREALFAATLVISYAIAWLAYILVERPALGFKSKHVRDETGTAPGRVP